MNKCFYLHEHLPLGDTEKRSKIEFYLSLLLIHGPVTLGIEASARAAPCKSDKEKERHEETLSERGDKES